MSNNFSLSQPCGCNNQGAYGTNFYDPNSQFSNQQNGCHQIPACSGCIEVINALCVIYTGSTLAALGINTNDTLSVILTKLNTAKTNQDAKNAKILLNLNDINSRINVIDSGTHPPYTLL